MSNDLVLNLRIRTNADGSAQVINQTADGIKRVSTESGNASNALRGMDSAASGLMRTLAPLVGIYQLISFGNKVVDDTAAVQDLDTRLHSLTKTAGDYAQTVGYINTVADEQHKKLNDLTDSYAKLRVLQNNGIITGQQTKGLYEGMNNAASALGAGNDQLKQSFYGLSQGLASGVLHAEELNQVVEPMQGLMNSLDNALGKGAGGFRRLTNDGKITSQMFAETLVKALHDYDGAAAATAQNINAKSTDISNSWTRLITKMEQPLSLNLNPALDAINSVLRAAAGLNGTALVEGVVTTGEIVATVYAGKMVSSIGSYVTAQSSAIAMERAHAAALAENLQVNIAAAQSTVSSTTAQLTETKITQIAAIETRNIAIAKLQAVNASIMSARATIAATEATVQNTTTQYINRQATEQLIIAEQKRAAVLAELALLGRQQAALSAQVTAAEAAQAEATAVLAAAQQAAVPVAATLLTTTNLLNAALAGMVGWEIGAFLSKFEAVKITANLALGSVIKDLRTLKYYWDSVQLAWNSPISMKRDDGSAQKALTAAYEKELFAINANIESTNLSILKQGDAVTATNQHTTAVAAINQQQGLSAEVTKKAAAEAKEHAEAIAHEIAALTDQHNKLAMSERAYELSKLAALGMKGAVLESAMALWDSTQALEAQKNSIDAGASALEAEKDRYDKLTMSVNEYLYTQLLAKGVSPGTAVEIVAQTSVNNDIEAKQKAQADLTAELTQYNSELDNANSKMQDFGKISDSVFSAALGGINGMAGAIRDMSASFEKSIEQLGKVAEARRKAEELTPDASKGFTGDYIKSVKAKVRAQEKAAEDQKKIEYTIAQETIAGMSYVAGFAGQMFEKRSAAARAFHAIEVTLTAASIAMSVAKNAASIAETLVNIPAAASEFFKQSGWWGFAGVAGMMGVLGALGFAAAGSGGGGVSMPPIDTTGMGTVLGDPGAVSKSIPNIIDTLKGIHAEEYVELRGINQGIYNLKNGIESSVTQLFQTGTFTGLQNQLMQIGSPIGGGSSNAAGMIEGGGMLGGLFGGGSSSEIVGGGIILGAKLVENILKGMNVGVSTYITTKVTESSLFGGDSTKYEEQVALASKSTIKSFSDVFRTSFDILSGMADSFGIDFTKKLEGYKGVATRIELGKLTGQEAVDKVTGAVSAVLDNVSKKVFADVLGQYQKLGEGMFETAARVLADVAVVKTKLGLAGVDLSGIDTSKLISISTSMVDYAGGVDKFETTFNDYYDKFFTASEKHATSLQNINLQLFDANILLPQTRQGYRDLISALQAGDDQSIKSANILIKNSKAASDYYDVEESIAKDRRSLEIQLMELTGRAIEALTAKRKDELSVMDETLRLSQRGVWAIEDANKAIDGAMNVLKSSVAAQKEILKTKQDAELSALKTTLDAAKKASDEQKQLATSTLNNLTSIASKLKSGMQADSSAADEANRRAAQSVLASALKSAQAGISLSGMQGLDAALAEVAKPAKNLFSTLSEYEYDQALTTSTIAQLSGFADSQVSVAQATLDAISASSTAAQKYYDDQAKILNDSYNLAITALDNQISTAQAQVDAANGNTQAVMSVSAAMAKLADAINAKINLSGGTPVAVNAVGSISTGKVVGGSVGNTTTGSDYRGVITATPVPVVGSVNAAIAAEQAAVSAQSVVDAAKFAQEQAAKVFDAAATKFDASSMALTAAKAELAAVGASKKLKGKALENAALAAYNTRTEADKQYGVAQSAVDAARQALADANQTLRTAEAANSTAKANAAATAIKIPGYAIGGIHSGGLRIVGENGPELEYTGPSRIFSNPQSRQLLDNGELIAEIKSLHATINEMKAEIKQLRGSSERTTENTKIAADRLSGQQPVPLVVEIASS